MRAVGEASAGGELDAGADVAGAELAGAVLEGAGVLGLVVSAEGEQAPRRTTPPPLTAVRPAARRTVRRVAVLAEDRWMGSGMRPPLGKVDERRE